MERAAYASDNKAIPRGCFLPHVITHVALTTTRIFEDSKTLTTMKPASQVVVDTENKVNLLF